MKCGHRFAGWTWDCEPLYTGTEYCVFYGPYIPPDHPIEPCTHPIEIYPPLSAEKRDNSHGHIAGDQTESESDAKSSGVMAGSMSSGANDAAVLAPIVNAAEGPKRGSVEIANPWKDGWYLTKANAAKQSAINPSDNTSSATASFKHAAGASSSHRKPTKAPIRPYFLGLVNVFSFAFAGWYWYSLVGATHLQCSVQCKNIVRNIWVLKGLLMVFAVGMALWYAEAYGSRIPFTLWRIWIIVCVWLDVVGSAVLMVWFKWGV